MYLDFGGHDGGPDRHRLALVPIHILPKIVNLLDDTSNVLIPDVSLYPPCLSQYPPYLFDFTHKRLVPVPGVDPLPLGRPKTLTNTPMLPQQEIKPPFHLHGYQLTLPPDLRGIPIYV